MQQTAIKGNNNPLCALLPCIRNRLCGSIHHSKGVPEAKGPTVIFILAMPYNGAYERVLGHRVIHLAMAKGLLQPLVQTIMVQSGTANGHLRVMVLLSGSFGAKFRFLM